MTEITISIAGRNYDVFCDDGEEADLLRLATIVDGKAQQAHSLLGGVNEVRTLLFAALFLADEQAAKPIIGAGNSGTTPDVAQQNSDQIAPIATALNRLAERLETLATRFEGD